MSDRHGPINVNVNVSQANTQVNQATSPDNSGCLGCLGMVGLLMVVGLIAKAFDASPVLGGLIVAVIAVTVLFLIVGKVSAVQDEKKAAAAAKAAEVRAAEIRADIESRATVDAIGGCMWCGHPESHRAENGHAVHPRDWHALEVDEAIRAAVDGPRPATAPSPPPTDHMTRLQIERPSPPTWSTAVPERPVARHAAPHHGQPPRVDGEAQLLDQLSYNETGECQWCGSPREHRSESGRIIHPAKFHQAEYEAERNFGRQHGR